MRLTPWALRPALAGCILAVSASCTDDESRSEPGFSPSPTTSAVASAYDIVKVPSLTIDGDLSDWTEITEISIADNSGRGGGLDNTAKVKLAWNDTYLFAAYNVTDTDLLELMLKQLK